MPKTKLQGVIFGLIMSVTMAYGMEVYNVALKSGGLSAMTNRVFWDALLEAAGPVTRLLFRLFQKQLAAA